MANGYYFEIYQEGTGGLLAGAFGGSPTHGQWRWTLKNRMGEPLASGESYHNKSDMLKTIGIIMNLSADTPIRER